jgi:glycosyltransferase involved in cell wall biosynthesis
MSDRRPMRLLLREHGICSGTETVNIHLIREFTQLVERVVWIVPGSRTSFFQQILPPSDRLVYELPDWPPEARLACIARKATSFALRQKVLPARSVFEHIRQSLFDLWLRTLIRQHNITHCFFTWTFGVNIPRISVPIGAMLMDVRWKKFPETVPQLDINRIEREFCDWLGQSSVLFPVSETTAADITRFYPRHIGKAQVVPHGAEIAPFTGELSEMANLDRTGRSVFFCPAAAYGHKNHLTLFRACVELFSKGFDFDLIITGYQTEYFSCTQPNDHCVPNGDATVRFACDFLHQHEQLFQGRIKPLGYVARAQVEELYRDCTAVIVPSFFEGFGLPVIEALQSGAPVICSDIPAHQEQLRRYGCSDQVALFPPLDAGALASEMAKILGPAGHRTSSRRVAPDALKCWTWRHVAEAYVDSLAAVTPSRNGQR